MTQFINYDAVLAELQAFGLLVDDLEIDTPRYVHVPTQDDKGRERKGWYKLYGNETRSGKAWIGGIYGDYREGGAHVFHTIKLGTLQLTPEEKAENDRRRREIQAAHKKQREAEAAEAAGKALEKWENASIEGESLYLQRKQIQPHGARFEGGNLIVPFMDVSGDIHGVQIIYGDPAIKKKIGRDKDNWPPGHSKQGKFFVLGEFRHDPGEIVCIAEGFATAASIHEATGYPTVMAIDAGNLKPVALALAEHLYDPHLLICADDDFQTEGNPGVRYAMEAAAAVKGSYVVPQFGERDGKKLTDFNDLHCTVGLDAVKEQILAEVAANGWQAESAGELHEGSGEGALRPITRVRELLERFSYVYSDGKTVFDHQEHRLVSLAAMQALCTGRELYPAWKESIKRRVVRLEEVGFDPSGKDPGILCNLWAGWPTTPRAGSCESILELLAYLCNNEGENSQAVYEWVLKWLAYPIQHPGAKMKTALVFHGKEGSGKNLFFECIKTIYGPYGRIIDQAAVEDKHNDWASKILFFIADEVVARAELYHMAGKLKSLITGSEIRINPKNVAAYNEANHANGVFLSNEDMPVVLGDTDRRYMVVYTPPAMSPQVYADTAAEIANGGIEALHDYLLNLDLGNFTPDSKPLMTRAKRDLIEVSKDSADRFWDAWTGHDLDGVPVAPCLSTDLYQLYVVWCRLTGNKARADSKFANRLRHREDCEVHVTRYITARLDRAQKTFVYPDAKYSTETQVGKESPEYAKWLGEMALRFEDGAKSWANGEN